MRMISLAWISMSTAWPAAPPWGWWMRIRALGRAKRFPFVPAARTTAAAEAACPMHIVETSPLMYCMVS